MSIVRQQTCLCGCGGTNVGEDGVHTPAKFCDDYKRFGDCVNPDCWMYQP